MDMEGFMAAFHSDEDKALKHLSKVVSGSVDGEEASGWMEADSKAKEETILKVGSELARQGKLDNLKRLIEIVRPYVVSLGKAKAAKIIRNLVDVFLDMKVADGGPEQHSVMVGLCEDCVEWAKAQKRVFLRQTLQARLVRLLNDIGRFPEASTLAAALVRELKKVDDKELILEVQLEESKAAFHLGNPSKARAALTSARTTANSIYVPPAIQAALDMQSGILHAADEKDFKTAFSYFYEAFEGFDSVEATEKALRALKYMLLSKIMLDAPDEVSSLLAGKLAAKYSGPGLEAMKAVAEAAKKGSLADFTAAFGRDFSEELRHDPVVKKHFSALRDSMLEKNLLRIITPYSRVQMDYVAEKMGLERAPVERKLSQMILDGSIDGILDQGQHVLVLFPNRHPDSLYDTSLKHLKALDSLLDSLHQLANKLS